MTEPGEPAPPPAEAAPAEAGPPAQAPAADAPAPAGAEGAEPTALGPAPGPPPADEAQPEPEAPSAAPDQAGPTPMAADEPATGADAGAAPAAPAPAAAPPSTNGAPPAANGDGAVGGGGGGEVAAAAPAEGGAVPAAPPPAGDAAPPAPPPPPAPPATKPPPDCPPAKRVRLRLDSGCVILYTAALPEDKRPTALAAAAAEEGVAGSGDGAGAGADANGGSAGTSTPATLEVVCLAQETVASLGWLGDGHVVELEQKLRTTHARAGPSAPPLTSVTAPGQAPLPAARSGAPMHPEFKAKCLDVLRSVQNFLGVNAWIFTQPVDPVRVPDYYKVITSPMDLGTVQRRLEGGEYSTPGEFADDVRLVWANCAVYNSRESDVGRLGGRVAAQFERLWGATGYDRARGRRVNAGVAATKYEPPPLPVGGGSGGGGGGGGGGQWGAGWGGGGGGGGGGWGGAAAPRPDRARSGGSAGRVRPSGGSRGAAPARPRPSPRGGGGGGGGARPAAARSGGGGAYPPGPPPVPSSVPDMPFERMQAIGALLGNLDGDALDGALAIVRHALGTAADGEGEVELDFDAIGTPALWELDAYLRARGHDTTGGSGDGGLGGMAGLEGPGGMGGGGDDGVGGGGGGWGASSDSE